MGDSFFHLDPRIGVRVARPLLEAVWSDLDRPPVIHIGGTRVSDNSFEKRVGEQLRDLEGTWVYHPPDDRMARQWKPGDFVFGHSSHWGVIEAKEVTGETFPVSNWSPQQRLSCQAVTRAGGTYWLLVRFVPSGAVAAFHGGQLEYWLEAHGGRGSLKAIEGRVLNRPEGKGFDLDLLVAIRPPGTR